ncbi:YibE/F family protein [Candidatus Solirubrobacter pratensis]|uniref:YibE/F family protein n=1 Tax=Candidatus Solirubrobacter pratensis TaxID=1298857 RepID=UPI000428A97E|nr:YibE/F family protein [Candidatus Solirubrobacter pratensis]
MDEGTIDRDQAERLARYEQRRLARTHEHAAPRLFASRVGKALSAAVAVLAALTLAGIVVLWPGGGHAKRTSEAMGGQTVGATVEATSEVRCDGPVPQACRRAVVKLGGGGRTALTLGPVRATPSLERGAHIRVQRVAVPQGAHGVEPYVLAGYDRRRPLLLAGLIFVGLVVAVTRLRGLLALGGLALSLLLVTKFVVPAILAGSPGLLVALVGSLAVMFVTVVLTYGVSGPSLAACISIGLTLGLAALAAAAFAHAAHLDGRSSELSSFLAGADAQLSLSGVVLAGIVLATLGVLADMGVTQASAVMALRQAAPDASARELYRRAFAVGRDHLVATTHTLVLVYAGATLPLLLVMHAAGVSTTDALNTQDLAEPVLGTLIGATALLVSVPLTTALTAIVSVRAAPEALGEIHAHAHG